MKLILAQDRPGQRPAELSFEQQKIAIGRDTSCDISFEKTDTPMVLTTPCRARMERVFMGHQ